MVDFEELKDKAQDLVGDHADEIKQGIDKAGDFVGEKIGGEEKIQGVENALTGFVDKLAGEKKE